MRTNKELLLRSQRLIAFLSTSLPLVVLCLCAPQNAVAQSSSSEAEVSESSSGAAGLNARLRTDYSSTSTSDCDRGFNCCFKELSGNGNKVLPYLVDPSELATTELNFGKSYNSTCIDSILWEVSAYIDVDGSGSIVPEAAGFVNNNAPGIEDDGFRLGDFIQDLGINFDMVNYVDLTFTFNDDAEADNQQLSSVFLNEDCGQWATSSYVAGPDFIQNPLTIRAFMPRVDANIGLCDSENPDSLSMRFTSNQLSFDNVFLDSEDDDCGGLSFVMNWTVEGITASSGGTIEDLLFTAIPDEVSVEQWNSGQVMLNTELFGFATAQTIRVTITGEVRCIECSTDPVPCPDVEDCSSPDYVRPPHEVLMISYDIPLFGGDAEDALLSDFQASQAFPPLQPESLSYCQDGDELTIDLGTQWGWNIPEGWLVSFDTNLNEAGIAEFLDEEVPVGFLPSVDEIDEIDLNPDFVDQVETLFVNIVHPECGFIQLAIEIVPLENLTVNFPTELVGCGGPAGIAAEDISPGISEVQITRLSTMEVTTLTDPEVITFNQSGEYELLVTIPQGETCVFQDVGIVNVEIAESQVGTTILQPSALAYCEGLGEISILFENPVNTVDSVVFGTEQLVLLPPDLQVDGLIAGVYNYTAFILDDLMCTWEDSGQYTIESGLSCEGDTLLQIVPFEAIADFSGESVDSLQWGIRSTSMPGADWEEVLLLDLLDLNASAADSARLSQPNLNVDAFLYTLIADFVESDLDFDWGDVFTDGLGNRRPLNIDAANELIEQYLFARGFTEEGCTCVSTGFWGNRSAQEVVEPSIWPNPTPGSLTISALPPKTLLHLTLLDLNGRVVMELKALPTEAGEIKIDISALSPAMYTLRMTHDTSTWVKSVILE